VFKGGVVTVLGLLLVACGAPKPRPSTPQTPPTAAPQLPPGLAAYRIDSAHSELRLLVYRAGPMARFGHNHVIVNRALEGWVGIAANGSPSSLSLSAPVAGFIVDDAQMRSEEGADFAGEIPDDAKSGTLRNMLGASLLDAAQFPTISLSSVAVQPAQGTGSVQGAARAATPIQQTWTATLRVDVAGHQSTLVLPFTLEHTAGGMSATGIVTLRQSALGLTPFSVMLGALQVQDELTVKFRLTASAP
jgi:hypothetical protein